MDRSSTAPKPISESIARLRERPSVRAAGKRQAEQERKREISKRLAGVKIKVYPEIILKAKANHIPSGAFRIWFLGKDFDSSGGGFIPAKKFRQHLVKMGIARATIYHWIDQAVEVGLVDHLGDYYRLAAWEIGAGKAGIEYPDDLSRMVYIPLDRFITKGWLAWVWAGYMKRFDGKEITRGTLEKLTGVPERTQRIYHKKAGIKSVANYADMGRPDRDPENAIVPEKEHGYFCERGRVFRQLGNTYLPEGVTLAKKGRTPTVKSRLRRRMLEGGSHKRHHQRLYCRNDKQAKAAIRQSKKGDARSRPNYIYCYMKQVSEKAQVWAGVAL